MESSAVIPLLETPRIILRPFQLDDLNALKAILDEPGIFRYFPNQSPWPEEKVRKYVVHHTDHWRERGYGHWAMALRETGQIVGWNGLEFLPDTNETEIGYVLSTAYWGRGLSTEAGRMIIDFGLNTVGLTEIIGLTHPENIASQRVLEKCGLAFTRRQVYFGMDMFRYAVLAQNKT
ncbi:MAG: GNAT family N-acetyltransferase [Chloroflexota bacterium]